MIKLTFMLDVDEDGWPPVAAEGLWCDQDGDFFRINNTPFFVKNIAYGDLIQVSAFDDAQVVLDRVVEESGNSTVWLYFQEDGASQPVLSELNGFGCGFEGGAIHGYFAVNVPKEVSMKEVERVLAPLEESGKLFVAYPADRHGDAAVGS